MAVFGSWIFAWILFTLASPLAAEPVGLIEVRLLSPLSTTDAKTWDAPVRAEIVRWIDGGDGMVPAHSVIWGAVLKAQPVGFGIVRERAALTLAFTHRETASGEVVPMTAHLVSIDNAREQVDANGKIRGILAANNPLGVLQGFWYQPNPHMFLRAAGGIPGTAGTVWARMAMGPIGAAGVFAAKLIFTRLPDPEITLLPGAEMVLRVETGQFILPEEIVPSFNDDAIMDTLATFPVDIQKPNGALVPDIINVALAGPPEFVRQAFAAAGWSEAEPLNRKSFGRTYKAFMERHGYSEAPVSTLLYQGRPPDLVFQKSLNSIAKRHHIRLWRVEVGGVEVWLGAASHDVTVTLDPKRMMLSHRIDPSLDIEVHKVLGDLVFSGAVGELSLVHRAVGPESAKHTDGQLAVVRLRTPVDQAAPDFESPNFKVPVMRRLVRRVTLEARQYLLRENVYYLGYLSLRRAFGRRPTAQAAVSTTKPNGAF